MITHNHYQPTLQQTLSTQQLNGTLAVTTDDGATIYPLKDGLGSTTATTNSTGTVTSTTAYTAYGTPTITGDDHGISAVAGYTGHQTNPDGLIYARARHYNPTTGTFLTQDSIAAVNPYKYGGDDPIDFSDPDGRLEMVEEALEDSRSQNFLKQSKVGALFGLGAGGALCAAKFYSDYETSGLDNSRLPREFQNFMTCTVKQVVIGAAAGGFGSVVEVGVTLESPPGRIAAACIVGGGVDMAFGIMGTILFDDPVDPIGVATGAGLACLRSSTSW